jgi:DNA-binding transcriptional ArsR family regulator
VAHVVPFHIIADPTRRRIVEVLRDGERPVNEVVERLDIHQSGVSRHLGILLDAGFVRVRAEGQRRLYSLRPEPFRELEVWLESYRRLWEGRLDRFEKAVEEKKAGKSKSKERKS